MVKMTVLMLSAFLWHGIFNDVHAFGVFPDAVKGSRDIVNAVLTL